MLINKNFYPYFRVPENIHQLVKLGDGIMDPFFNHEHMTVQGVKGRLSELIKNKSKENLKKNNFD